jgi:hypothetical protein
LITTNQGETYLYRNEQLSGNRGLRLRLTGTKSNRDAIGALVRVFGPDGAQSRRVKSGSSYLSQSELTLTFGLGKRDAASRLVIEWPSGAVIQKCAGSSAPVQRPESGSSKGGEGQSPDFSTEG